MILGGGALLLTPGFLTDFVGLMLLLPPSRALLRPLVLRAMTRRVAAAAGPGALSPACGWAAVDRGSPARSSTSRPPSRAARRPRPGRQRRAAPPRRGSRRAASRDLRRRTPWSRPGTRPPWCCCATANGGLEILLVERTGSAGFVPGAHVFPGGAVDPADGHGARPGEWDLRREPAPLTGVAWGGWPSGWPRFVSRSRRRGWHRAWSPDEPGPGDPVPRPGPDRRAVAQRAARRRAPMAGAPRGGRRPHPTARPCGVSRDG